MDYDTKRLEYTSENISSLEKKGYSKSSYSRRPNLNDVICYNTRRKVYWFTDKWIAAKIDAKIDAKMFRSTVNHYIII